MVLYWKSLKEYQVNAGVPQGSIFGPTPFLLYINNLPDDVICDTAMYADDILSILSVSRYLICGNSRHLICHNNKNWLLNLNLIYKTLWTGAKNGLLITMLEKLTWFRLTSLITLMLLI